MKAFRVDLDDLPAPDSLTPRSQAVPDHVEGQGNHRPDAGDIPLLPLSPSTRPRVSR